MFYSLKVITIPNIYNQKSFLLHLYYFKFLDNKPRYSYYNNEI